MIKKDKMSTPNAAGEEKHPRGCLEILHGSMISSTWVFGSHKRGSRLFAKRREIFYYVTRKVIPVDFRRLSDVIDQIKELPVAQHDDVITQAAMIYVEHYRHVPIEMLNIITLALLMDRLQVYEMSPGAIRVIGGMRIDDLPAEPPPLLRLPWLVESKDLDTPLFGNTVCLGGYFIRGKYFLVGFMYPDGARVEPWEPEWGNDLKIDVDWSPFVEPGMQGTREGWAKEAARFSLGLGLLLEAEKTPLAVKQAGKSGRKRRGGRRSAAGEWITRRVILGKMATRYYGQQPAGTGKIDKSDKVLARTVVTGHLRYQPFGPGREQRKWVWIDSYEAHRWTRKKTKIEITDR
jgi:hypothetical protein